MRFASLVFLLATAITARAQWEIEDSHTNASLRGIHNVGGGVAWASGTGGTVLRTTDDGKTWQTCPVPLAGTKDTAEKLDFRGIQAFDEKTAIVMSSGPGDLSRLYKTTDGCQTWKLLFTNPDKDGFWDALVSDESGDRRLILVGDPVGGYFPEWYLWNSLIGKKTRFRVPAHSKESLFAASNSSIFLIGGSELLATGGEGGGRVIRNVDHGGDELSWVTHPGAAVPVGDHTESSGIFSIAFDETANLLTIKRRSGIWQAEKGIAVGGDYLKPTESARTAAFTDDGGDHWLPAQTPPHGYRSAVAYDPDTKTWITVGPNGTDISTDDGRNWRALTPTPEEAPDADKNWNALSLPFVVGPHGRIGKLRATALAPPASRRIQTGKP